MAVRIEHTELLKQARQFGEDGANPPPWVANDPEFQAAYDAGAGKTPDEAPANTPTPKVGGTHSSGGSTSRAGSRSKNPSPRLGKVNAKVGEKVNLRGRARDLVSHPLTLGSGDGGGLLLAIFAYPIVLAMLQHGPAGAGIWLKAKFLNKVTPRQSAPAPSVNPPKPINHGRN